MNDDARWQEAADRATDGPSAPQAVSPEDVAAESAAATAARALVPPQAPPAALRERLRRDAAAVATARAAGEDVLLFPSRRSHQTSAPRANPWFPRQAWGWQAAAAAGFLFAIWSGFRPAPIQPQVPLAELRATLSGRADAVSARFAPGYDRYAGLEGDVVWSRAEQGGFLRLRGIPANDPNRTQYQLWIVDPERDEEFPVDGGVFDVPPGGGDTIVAFRPRLPVSRPVAFVITREQPGGTVKSRNAKPVAIAKL